MGKTRMVNMKKLVGQGELGGVMVRLMMALQEQITRSRSFSAVATCQDHLWQASAIGLSTREGHSACRRHGFQL